MPDYRSNADLLAAQRNKDNNDQMGQLFHALMQGQNQQNLAQTQGEQTRASEAEKAGRQKEFLAPYLDAKNPQKLPGGISQVNFEGASLHDNTVGNAYKQQAQDARNDTLIQHGSSAVQGAFDKQTAEFQKAIEHARQSKRMVGQNTLYSLGPEQIQFIKSMAGQKMAASEIPLGAPKTIWQDINTKIAKWQEDPSQMPIMSPHEQKALGDVLDGIENQNLASMRDVHKKITAAAPTLAAGAYRLGRGADVMAPINQFMQEKYSAPEKMNLALGPKPNQGGGLAGGLLRTAKGASQAVGNAFNGLFSGPGQANASQVPQKAPGLDTLIPGQEQNQTTPPQVRRVRQKSTGKVFDMNADGSMTEVPPNAGN